MQARPLKIATYNIHRCRGTDGKADVYRTAEVIQELDCDVVGLQEVDNDEGSTAASSPRAWSSCSWNRARFARPVSGS